jgi:hypothetical protein
MIYFFIVMCRAGVVVVVAVIGNAVVVLGDACGCDQKGAIRAEGEPSKEGNQVLIVKESMRRRPSL